MYIKRLLLSMTYAVLNPVLGLAGRQFLVAHGSMVAFCVPVCASPEKWQPHTFHVPTFLVWLHSSWIKDLIDSQGWAESGPKVMVESGWAGVRLERGGDSTARPSRSLRLLPFTSTGKPALTVNLQSIYVLYLLYFCE